MSARQGLIATTGLAAALLLGAAPTLADNLGVKAEAVVDRLNAVGAPLGPEFGKFATTTPCQTQKRTVCQFDGPGVLGSVAQDPGENADELLLIMEQGDAEKSKLVIWSMVVVMGAFSPSIPQARRLEAVIDMGNEVMDLEEGKRTVTFDGVNYHFGKNDTYGLWFIAETY